jgi:pimeloyl-ACP methyl ester carboxylesterase
MTASQAQGQYAAVNGIDLYYEIHGSGQPLVLLHGAFSAIGTSFGPLLPSLAENRMVIGVELQGHGHTADIDRPMRISHMADDVAALLRHLGLPPADLFGYSMGAGVALQVASQYPELVRKLVVASVSYNSAGLHPGLIDGLAGLQPEWLIGTPWHDEYMRSAPRPEDFATLVRKVTEMNMKLPNLPDEAISTLQAPTLIIIGDSDIVRPEHAVEMFRLLGGGISGDGVPMPKSRLAVLPATSHTMVVAQTELLSLLVRQFLDAPMPDMEA